MADVDQAITELRGQRNASNGSNAAADRSRRSFQSERTADLSADDDATEDGESEYQARTNARAALAAKAKANAALSEKKDREEQERMRLHAKKVFEEEEARHRQLLLQKEQERKEAAAMGQLPTESDKRKVAPIEGVDMSDDSDSEGSANGLDTYTSATAAPAKLSSSSASPAAGRLALDESERAHVRDTSVKDELDDAPVNPSAAGAAAKSTQATGSTAATTLGDSQRGPSLDSAQQRSQSDQQSLTASTRPSHPDTASIGGGTGTHTAATSSAGKDTPKSISAPFAAAPVGGQGSPAPSVSASNRPAAPAGDAQDWSVDQVVEWARSKGWDENAVVSKFQEHEISGDVLLEMDVNILKEIDIVAFGKRFQVANAIKELKGHVNLSPSAGFGGAPPSSSSGRVLSSAGQSHHSTDSQPAAAASSAAAAAAGLGAYQGVGLGVPGGENDAAAVTNRAISYDAGTVIHHGSPALQQREREFSGSSMPPLGSTDASQGMSLAAMADAALLNRQGNNLSPPPRQQQQQQSGGFPSSPSANASPRKRSSKMSGSAERTSFFGGFNPRQRKPPAATPQSTIAEDGKSGKGMGTGTLSRFGLNRSLKNGQQQGSGDFKNQISLPTSSPTYDSEGDTARRNRASAASTNSNTGGRALGGYEAAVGGGHGRQASVGSAAPEQPKASTFNPNDPQEASGPVIARIRPVDVEGWMRKKGERYNSWKPRYLALKGSDLVILRDPQAQKIKGYVSMKGYKVIADENTNPGKYGFKILHESEKPHYFSSDDPILVREWMKGLMKATIGRDPNFPVISSYNNATISLKEAQSMYPPPRPPSPASRLRTQRAKARENPGELTEKDQAVLMGISQPQKGQAGM